MVSRMIPRIPTLSGIHIPGIGFGTYQSFKGELKDALGCALDVGYRHIDMAISYDNDAEIGEVLKPLFRHDTLERKDLFLTTKVPPIYMEAKYVHNAVVESMEKLGTNYVDLLLIHVPFGVKNMGDGNFAPVDEKGNRILADYDYIETWREMEKLFRIGAARMLGLSNFSAQQIEHIKRECKLKPVNLQYECHAFYQQNSLRKYCQENGIVSTGYSPMGAPTRPDFYQREEHVTLLEDPVVKSIAEKLGKTPGQILIRYVSQIGVIPLPKSVTPKRILENFEAMFFDIPAEDMKKLQALDCGMKYFTFDWAKSHPKFPVGDF